MLAAEVGWADGDYVFSCMDYTAMMADLSSPAGNCSLSATGVEVLPETLDLGLKFSWPTYKSGLRVMISAHLQTGSTWAFSEIFRWEVWLLLGATAVAVGVLVAALEWMHREPSASRTSKGWQSWLWYSLCKVFHVVAHVGDPLCDASRVLVLGYGFLVLVMISMYTAAAASRITAAALVHPVHSEKDLKGSDSPYKTLTWDHYLPAIQGRQKIVSADGMPWEHEDDLHAMVAALRAGTYSALILDAPVLEYTAGTNEACDLFLVGEVFESFSLALALALAFPAAFDDAAVYAFSQSIVKLQTYQNALDMLESVYIKTGGTEKCFGSGGNSGGGGHGSGETIELRQVSGLWYILLITVGVCLVLTVAHNVRKDPRKMARLRTWHSFAGTSMARERHASDAHNNHSSNAVQPFHASCDDGHSGGAAPHRGASGSAPGLQPGLQPAAGAAAPAQQHRTRGPSTLSVFLGTSESVAGHDSDDECASPASPVKRAPQHARLYR